MSKELLIDIIGWAGSVEVVLAYAMVSAKRLKADSWLYQLLNLTGAVFLIINTYCTYDPCITESTRTLSPLESD